MGDAEARRFGRLRRVQKTLNSLLHGHTDPPPGDPIFGSGTPDTIGNSIVRRCFEKVAKLTNFKDLYRHAPQSGPRADLGRHSLCLLSIGIFGFSMFSKILRK